MSTRTATTLAELDALPVGSVIRVKQERTMEKFSDGWFSPVIATPYKAWPIWLPAQILYTPGPAPAEDLEWGLRTPLSAMPNRTGSESLMHGYQKIHGGTIYHRTAPGAWVEATEQPKHIAEQTRKGEAGEEAAKSIFALFGDVARRIGRHS